MSRLFLPDAKNKFTTSHANYNQFETFDHSNASQSEFKHNVSIETLKSLKAKRSKRRMNNRCARNIKDHHGTVKSNFSGKVVALPQANNLSTYYANQSSMGPIHTKVLSTDANMVLKKAKNPYTTVTCRHSKNNIWAAERINSIKRQQQTEEMKSMLKKQKVENNEKHRLELQIKRFELDDMEFRIKQYK